MTPPKISKLQPNITTTHLSKAVIATRKCQWLRVEEAR
jgi:hypothetical protein